MPHPVIFDRGLLRARRARRGGADPATFLLDRVADDLAARLSAVLRTFDLAADLGTPTDAVRRALAGRVGTIVAVDPSRRNAGERLAVVADEEALPFRDGSLDLVVSALRLAVRQRSARHADPDPPRAEAGRIVARRADRRRQPDRIARRPSRRPKPRSRAASRRGSRRSPICAISARCCSAPASRCRSPTSIASPCATPRRSR